VTEPTLADDLAVALTLAAEADLIAIDRYRAQDLDVQLKPDRTQVTDADTRVERMIREHLAAARPDDAVLGEEFGGGDPHAPRPAMDRRPDRRHLELRARRGRSGGACSPS
jgi:histidinol-phosphatase